MKDIAVIPNVDTAPFLYQNIRIRNGYGFIENQIEEKTETTLQPAGEAAVVNEEGCRKCYARG